jgi:hypothetical protein
MQLLMYIVIYVHVIEFPSDASMDIKKFNLSMIDQLPVVVRERMKLFGGERTPVFYGEDLQNAHHIHFMNGKRTRLLQLHYGNKCTSICIFVLIFSNIIGYCNSF